MFSLSLKKRVIFFSGVLSFAFVVLISFQNCGPQPPATCQSNSTDSSTDPATDGNSTSPLSGCSTSTVDAASNETLTSPFQGSSSTGGTSAGNYSTTRSTAGGSRTGSGTTGTGASGQTDGYGLTRTCSSTGCPGTTFMFQYEPKSITVDEGTPATIRGVAVNAKGTISYQWYKDNSPLATATNYSATSGTLYFYPTALTDNGVYFLRATDAGSNKSIDSSKITVKVVEVIIDCAQATYGWNSVPISRYVVGAPATFDQWNPPGHKYFLAASTSLPNGSPIGFDNSGQTDMGSVLFNPPSKILEGNFTSATCQGIRSGSAKAANALGIPSCPSSFYYTQTLTGEVSLKCTDGKLEIISVSSCACEVSCISGYTRVNGQCYQECTYFDGVSGYFPGYIDNNGACLRK